MAVGDQKLQRARYWNSNGKAAAIVAVISEGIDWAAYAGGVDSNLSRSEASYFVAQNGEKLTDQDAWYFFPEIELPYRY